MQSKVLRFLETRIFRRVGSEEEITVDLQIISSSQTDLKKMINEGTFRKDLYFRLNALSIQIPTLRDRPADIETIFTYFFEKYIKVNTVS